METRNSFVVVIFLTITLLLAFYLRTVGLASQSLGFDETMAIYAAKSIVKSGSPILPSGMIYNRAYPFTYSVALSFKFFGMSAFSARIPSIVFGMFSIIIVFLFASVFFDRSVGILAALFMAFVPFEVVWSRTCRMYSMYQFLFLCTFYAFYMGFEKQSNLSKQRNLEASPAHSEGIFFILSHQIGWPWMVMAALFGFSAYKIHPLVLGFGGSIFVYVVLFSIIMFISTGFRSVQTKKYFYASVFAMVIGGVCLSLPGFLEKIQSLHHFEPSWASNIKVSPLNHLKFLFSPQLIPFMFFFLLGAFQAVTRMSKPALYTITCVIVPLFIQSMFVRIQRPRYIYDIFPLLLIISAFGVRNIFTVELTAFFATLREKLKLTGTMTKIARVALVIFFAILFFIPTPTLLKGLTINKQQAAFLGGDYNADWKKACKYLAENSKPDDIIIASIPLAADFYGCKVNYNLDNGEIDQFIRVKGSSLQRHAFAAVYAIIDLPQLEKVISQNNRGWIIADKQRFDNPANIPLDIQEFVTTHLKRHKTPADSTMYIFSWDRTPGIEG
jgi:4-amino-4-deoxy-L-arabinose transferase-like glycosyltransferase